MQRTINIRLIFWDRNTRVKHMTETKVLSTEQLLMTNENCVGITSTDHITCLSCHYTLSINFEGKKIW
jgi:hypothetical protein